MPQPPNLNDPPSPKAKRRRGRRILWGLLTALLGALGWFIWHWVTPRNYKATGEPLPLHLEGGLHNVLFYCRTPEPRGIVIVGTGDGGWSYWEERTSLALASRNYAVGGWDCRKFADTRVYGQKELIAGFNAAVEAVRKRAGLSDDAPVWYGGWSTGAEQSVAAAATSNRPKQLRGLWLAGPGERGRYGITTADLLGKTPTGPGSFALADLGADLRGLPVAQFTAGLDPLDDTDWLDSYEGPKRLIKMKGMLHDMGGAGEEFQAELEKALQWTLNP